MALGGLDPYKLSQCRPGRADGIIDFEIAFKWIVHEVGIARRNRKYSERHAPNRLPKQRPQSVTLRMPHRCKLQLSDPSHHPDVLRFFGTSENGVLHNFCLITSQSATGGLQAREEDRQGESRSSRRESTRYRDIYKLLVHSRKICLWAEFGNEVRRPARGVPANYQGLDRHL